MDLAVTQKPRIFQSGNKAKHPGLRVKFQMVLKADKVIGVRSQIFLSQLDNCVRLLTGAGIAQAYRLHGSEA